MRAVVPTRYQTEKNSLTLRAGGQEVLVGEHADVPRGSVAVMVREIVEVEIARLAGVELDAAALGELLPEVPPAHGADADRGSRHTKKAAD